MKDAGGHGSNARGQFGERGTSHFKTAGLRGVGIKNDASFRPRYSDAQRTVEAMRSQMQNTGSGHRAGLLQGIKNLLGG